MLMTHNIPCLIALRAIQTTFVAQILPHFLYPYYKITENVIYLN